MLHPEPRASSDISGSECTNGGAAALKERAQVLNRCAPATLYSFPAEPFDTRRIAVGQQGEIYVEQYGNPQGSPVVYIHGGLVMPLRPESMGFLNADELRVISVHQRGAGKSVPFDDLKMCTTLNSVWDIECARRELGIESWNVYGHSFGGGIALLYAASHQERVRTLTCHGAFLPGGARTQVFLDGERTRLPEVCRRRAAHFEGCSEREALGRFAAGILPAESPERDDLIRAYWGMEEGEPIAPRQLNYTRLMLWYRINDYFLEDSWLDDVCARLNDVPVRVVHSVEDEIVPIASSVELAGRLPRSGLSLVLGEHFYKSEPARTSLRRVFDRFDWR